MKILVFGSTGMAGHVITLYLSEQGYDVTAFTRRPFHFVKNIIGDIRDTDLVKATIETGDYDVIINAIGILNYEAELDKANAVFINSFIPHLLAELTKNAKTKVIHMSTDCVFSGETGRYIESSFKDGTTFYDRTKALGEIENNKDLTFRNSIIGPDMSPLGKGLFNWFMLQHDQINGYTHVIWTGVTTLTLAKAMEAAIRQKLAGMYNLVNNKPISKYQLLSLFNEYFRSNQLIILPSECIKVDKSLINTRKDFDFQIPDYEVMLIEMREWMLQHQYLYSHYRLTSNKT